MLKRPGWFGGRPRQGCWRIELVTEPQYYRNPRPARRLYILNILYGNWTDNRVAGQLGGLATLPLFAAPARAG